MSKMKTPSWLGVPAAPMMAALRWSNLVVETLTNMESGRLCWRIRHSLPMAFKQLSLGFHGFELRERKEWSDRFVTTSNCGKLNLRLTSSFCTSGNWESKNNGKIVHIYTTVKGSYLYRFLRRKKCELYRFLRRKKCEFVFCAWVCLIFRELV